MRRDLRLPPDGAGALGDEDLVWAVTAPAFEAADIYGTPEELDETLLLLTPGQRALLAIHWCVSEVCNGGFDQFFANSTGILAAEALDGFRRVGATEYAAIVTEAMNVFEGGVVPLDREGRNRQLDSGADETSSILSKLDDRFYVDLESLTAIRAEYVRAHLDEFVRAPDPTA